jgi:hypothetical protein
MWPAMKKLSEHSKQYTQTWGKRQHRTCEGAQPLVQPAHLGTNRHTCGSVSAGNHFAKPK